MDMKKGIVLAAVVVVLSAVLFGIFAFSGGKEEPAPETEPTVTTEETIIPTTEATIPGLEDSIFDDETTEATEPTEETKEKNPGSTKPTQPQHPDEPESTKPKPTEPEPTDPTEGTPVVEEMDYEAFQNMSPTAQQAFVETFDSIEDFFAWLNDAKEAYEQSNSAIEVEGGAIDIGAIIEGKE